MKIFTIQNFVLLVGIVIAIPFAKPANATELVSDSDRQDALSYVESRLAAIDPQEAAFEYYLEAQEDLLSQEGNPEIIRVMASTYRHDRFEAEFEALFEPLSREVFEYDGVWHVVTLRGEKIFSHVCYRHTSAQAVACP